MGSGGEPDCDDFDESWVRNPLMDSLKWGVTGEFPFFICSNFWLKASSVSETSRSQTWGYFSRKLWKVVSIGFKNEMGAESSEAVS